MPTVGRAEVAILRSETLDFKTKIVVRNKKKRLYKMIKSSIPEEDIAIVNIYATNKSWKILEANIDRIKERIRKYNNS